MIPQQNIPMTILRLSLAYHVHHLILAKLPNPLHDDTPEELVDPSVLLNLNTNGTESSGISSDQDPIQSSQLLRLQDMCVDHSIGPKLTYEPLFNPLKTLWHDKPDPVLQKEITDRTQFY